MMRSHPPVPGPLSLLILCAVLASACASGGSTKAVTAGSPQTVGTTLATGIISCQTFVQRLTDTQAASPFLEVMQDYSSTYTNTDNGQAIRFLAVQPTNDSTGAYETLVFFNGTSQITPDWPIAMLVQGTSSLCDDNALIFSDYPGIGGTDQPLASDFTFDNISYNVYNLMASLNDDHGFEITSVNPIGWSLGTEAALKFAAAASWNSGFSGRGMKIDNLFLVAPKAGGDTLSTVTTTPLSCSSSAVTTTYYAATGNPGMCVASVLDQMLTLDTASWDLAVALKGSLVGVMFPYLYTADGESQAPYGADDPGTICAVTIDTEDNEVSAMCNLEDGQSIETPCTASTSSTCSSTLQLYQDNRKEEPYLDDISYEQFSGQRSLNFTYDFGYCDMYSTASWTANDCFFNQSEIDSSLYNPTLMVNASPCKSAETTSASSSPTVLNCDGFAYNFKGVYIFNGAEDMFIRHDYGSALCQWFNSTGKNPCTLNTYDDTGHGVMYDKASEIYSVISGAL